MDSEAYTKARNEAVGKTAKGYEAKRAALRNLGDPPQEPLMPVIVTDDVTVEGIQRQLADGIPSLGIFSDEAGKIVGGHAMNPENLLKSISHLSTYWDGRDTVRLRRGDGASVLHGKRVSLHYMLQPLVSSLLLKSNLIKDQGFLSRCLPAWPVSTAGTRAYKAVDLGAHPKMRAYMGRMTAILKKPFPVKNRNELQPRPLPLTSDAKQIWKGFYNSVEVELGHSGRYASVRGLGNKAAEHAARLAAVLTLVKDLRAPQIQITEMDAGITLAHFYLEEALRIQETDVVDENIRLAETLLGWLHKRDDGFVTLRQICHEGPNAIRKGDTALQILAILEMHDWVRLIGPKRWAVTPSESED
jgi:hypothetical protein